MNEPELTPDEEAEVARLLADAAPPVAMPASVAARLDSVLAELVAEREIPVEDDVVVVPLTRKRRWPQILVAAAAVSLFGYVGTSLVRQGASDSGGAAMESTADSADSADRSAGDDGGAESEPQPSVPGPAAAPQDAEADRSERELAELTRQLSGLVDQRLLRDAANNADPATKSTSGVVGSLEPEYLYKFAPGRTQCSLPARSPGDRVYRVPLGEDRLAVVVVRPLDGSAARADVYPCRGSLFPVRSSLVLAAR